MLLDTDISAVQRVRDVGNVFTLARAVENPFSTMVRKGPKPRSTLFEEPFKARRTPEDSAIADGVDVADSELSNNEANKCMLQGRLQKGRVAIAISDLADEFGDEYAASNLKADNLSDAIIQARENLEVTCLKTSDSQPYGGTSTPAKTRGLGSWIRSANPGGTPDLPINALALTPSTNIDDGNSAATDISDVGFNTVMQSIATAARMKGDWDVFVHPDLQAVIDQWSRHQSTAATSSTHNVPLRQFTTGMADGTVTMEIRQFVTSQGRLRFHCHYSLPTGVWAYIVKMDSVQLRPGYSPRTRELPYLGGGYKTIVEYVYGLMANNPRAIGKFTT
jgi:hypothetical protein